MRRKVFILSLLAMAGAAGAYLIYLIPPGSKSLFPVTYGNPGFSSKEVPEFGFVNTKGRLVISQRYMLAGLWDDEGMMLIGTKQGGKVKYGWIGLEAETLLEPKWDMAMSFRESGFAPVRSNGKWGLIDRKGTVVGPLVADKSYWMNDAGLFPAKDPKSGLWGWVDSSGKIQIPFEWEEVSDFDAADMALVRKNGLWGWVNKEGEVVIEPKWEGALLFDQNDRAAVGSGFSWGWIDREGEVIVEPTYPSIIASSRSWSNGRPLEPATRTFQGSVDDSFEEYLFHIPSNTELGMVGVQDEETERWGWVDLDGNVLIPFEWKEAWSFDESGLAPVMDPETGKWSWIKKDGELLLPPAWDRVTPFNEQGLAAVSIDDKWGVIDRAGNAVIDLEWDYVVRYDALKGYFALGRSEEPTRMEIWLNQFLNWFRSDDQVAQPVWRHRWLELSGDVFWDSRDLKYEWKCFGVLGIAAIVAFFSRPRRRKPPPP